MYKMSRCRESRLGRLLSEVKNGVIVGRFGYIVILYQLHVTTSHYDITVTFSANDFNLTVNRL